MCSERVSVAAEVDPEAAGDLAAGLTPDLAVAPGLARVVAAIAGVTAGPGQGQSPSHPRRNPDPGLNLPLKTNGRHLGKSPGRDLHHLLRRTRQTRKATIE